MGVRGVHKPRAIEVDSTVALASAEGLLAEAAVEAGLARCDCGDLFSGCCCWRHAGRGGWCGR